MPLEFYYTIHTLGLLMMFFALGGIATHQLRGDGSPLPLRALHLAVHGLGWLAIFIAGFALSGKGGFGFPGWVIVKLVILVALGLAPSAILRGWVSPKVGWLSVLIAGSAAILLARLKPF